MFNLKKVRNTPLGIWWHRSTPLFKEGVNFNYLLWRWTIWKIKKALKGEGGSGWHLPFFEVLSFLHLEITLCKHVLCIWRKKIFFCHHNFMKKSDFKLSKNEPGNISQNKVTWYICKGIYKIINWFLIESDSWTGKIAILIFV